MSLHNPTDFRRAWDALDDPKAIREAMEQDQANLDECKVFKLPDGLFFEIARTLPCGTVVTDAGLWLAPDEFSECERYV